jgi:DNA polymerase-3 subunit beta
MKFIITQSDLNHALRLVGKAVGSAKMHPILCNVLLRVKPGSLEATCYNIDMGIRHTTVALAEEHGSITVPYKLLSEIVYKIDRQSEINFETNGESLILKTSNSCYRLSTTSAQDFPDLPVIDSKNSIDLTVSESLRAVLSCCSTDESKQILTGIHFRAASDELRLESTDGHRLSIRKQSCESTDIDVVIPAKTMQQVLRIDSPQISISFDKYQASIAVDDSTTIVSRVLDGTFPDVDQLIPKTFKHTLTVDRRKMLETLERIAIICCDGSNIVKLKSEDEFGNLLIQAESETGHGSENMPSTGTLPDIAFNVNYLIDGIKQFQGDEIELLTITSMTPAIIKCAKNNDNIYLVMPVQIRQS